MHKNKQGLIIPDWPAPKNVRTLVTTRISFQPEHLTNAHAAKSSYDSFNLALHVDDDAQHVIKNREQLAQYLHTTPSDIAWLEQVHGTQIADTESACNETIQTPIAADACTSTRPNKVCSIMTADCLPVLFCNLPTNNHDTQKVAAAHAGWRGLANGILSKTVDSFANPEQVIAWLGPAISQAHFEVGQEVYDAFVEKNIDNTSAFIPSKNATSHQAKWLASLIELAKIELHTKGIKAVYGGEFCTYSQPELFYSYRRDGSQSGRMASLIMIT